MDKTRAPDNCEVRLRNIEPNDLLIFYEQQLDADATRMAAFPSRDRAAFDAHWAKILGNPAMVKQAILTVTPRFSSRRMLKDYAENAYLPAFRHRQG